MSAALVTSVSALLFMLPVDHISLGIRSDMLIEYKRKKACLLYIFWEHIFWQLKISSIASNMLQFIGLLNLSTQDQNHVLRDKTS